MQDIKNWMPKFNNNDKKKKTEWLAIGTKHNKTTWSELKSVYK